MKIEKKLIKELVGYLDEFKLSEIEYGNNDLKIKVSKNINQNVVSSANNNIVEKKDTSSSKGIKITSPINVNFLNLYLILSINILRLYIMIIPKVRIAVIK